MRILTGFCLSLAIAAHATPVVLSQSGRLIDGADTGVNQVGLVVGFSLWTDPTASAPEARLWPVGADSPCPTTVHNGYYGLLLDGAGSGCGAGLTAELLDASTPRYLGMSIGGTALFPRLRVGNVPTAVLATKSKDAQALQAALLAQGSINATGNPVDWTRLKNVPLAFADGTDDGNTYEADNATLALATGVFSVKAGGVGPAQLASDPAAFGKLSGGTVQLDALGNLTLTGTGKVFTGSGAGLTALNAAQITTGVLPDSGLAGTYGAALQLTNAANILSGSGTGLTLLDAGNLASGTVPAARLPPSSARTDATVPQLFAAPIGVGTSAGLSCGGVNEGAIAYNFTTHRLEFCNGTSLQPVGSPMRQFKFAQTTAALSLPPIPWDNTIPQITEGGLVASVTLTPTAAGNSIVLEGIVVWSEPANTGNNFTVAVFRQGTSNALAATGDTPQNNNGGCAFELGYNYVCTTPIRYVFTSTGTSVETFELRAGMESGTTFLNRGYDNASQGGKLTSSLTATEIAP